MGWIEAVAIIIAGLVVEPQDIGAGQGFFASMRAVTGTIACKLLKWDTGLHVIAL